MLSSNEKTRTKAGLVCIYLLFQVDERHARVYKDIQKGRAMELETDSRKLLKVLKSAGFEEVSKRGSHLKLRKGDKIVILPHPKKNLPIGTVRNIYKQAGLL